ncbi:hypothetical protein RsS62_09980 [Rhizobium dioscoreae]|nr:hypothetical protein RsS62_09980 [Rhizobium dioscoreae]
MGASFTTNCTLDQTEIEDLLKDTLIRWWVPSMLIIDLLWAKGGAAISYISSRRPASRDHTTVDLSDAEKVAWMKLLATVNSPMK